MEENNLLEKEKLLYAILLYLATRYTGKLLQIKILSAIENHRELIRQETLDKIQALLKDHNITLDNDINLDSIKAGVLLSILKAKTKDDLINKIQLIATTENSKAMEDAVKSIKSDIPLYKQWDATLDKRTCKVCDQNDGLIISISESYPGGDPGYVHPNCRCQSIIIT